MLINMLYRHNRPVVVQSPVVMDSRMEGEQIVQAPGVIQQPVVVRENHNMFYGFLFITMILVVIGLWIKIIED